MVVPVGKASKCFRCQILPFVLPDADPFLIFILFFCNIDAYKSIAIVSQVVHFVPEYVAVTDVKIKMHPVPT